MTIIYRLQCETDGIGVYSTAAGDVLSKRNATNHRPNYFSDIGLCSSPLPSLCYTYRYAWQSLALALRWLDSLDELVRMEAACTSLRLYIYEIPDACIIKGDAQCLFREEDVTTLLDKLMPTELYTL